MATAAQEKGENIEQKPTPVPRPDEIFLARIKKAAEEMDNLDAKAKEINAKRSAIIEGLESKGVNRHAFRYARQVLGMKECKREGLDLSYMLCRQAMGLPVQTDWLDDSQD